MNRPSYYSIICKKPQLFHYTCVETAMKLLRSKSLLLQPIWNYVDTGEYILGLNLISQRLKGSLIKKSNPLQIQPNVKKLLDENCGGLTKVIEQVIDQIDYEIANLQKPRVEVYVACFSKNPCSVEMVKNYGQVIIRFNPLLHLFAYENPSPFSASMISRVTYNEQEFQNFVVDMGINFPLGQDTQFFESEIEALLPEQRTEDISTYISEHLCMFAPNIKRPKFSYEEEWRLKSVVSNHKYSADFYSPSREGDKSSPFPTYAKPTKDKPTRYFHELTFKDKFISQEIMIFSNDGGRLSAEVGEWQRDHSLGQMTQQQVETIARKLDESRGAS